MSLEADSWEGHEERIPTLLCQMDLELGPKEVDIRQESLAVGSVSVIRPGRQRALSHLQMRI